MSEHNVVDAIWFNAIGIVRVRPGTGEDKFYIGGAEGINEEDDVQRIAAWGTPIHFETLASFFARPIKAARAKAKGEE